MISGLDVLLHQNTYSSQYVRKVRTNITAYYQLTHYWTPGSTTFTKYYMKNLITFLDSLYKLFPDILKSQLLVKKIFPIFIFNTYHSFSREIISNSYGKNTVFSASVTNFKSPGMFPKWQESNWKNILLQCIFSSGKWNVSVFLIFLRFRTSVTLVPDLTVLCFSLIVSPHLLHLKKNKCKISW